MNRNRKLAKKMFENRERERKAAEQASKTKAVTSDKKEN